MYRIRLASGEEAVYRTAEELAKAVSSGVVSATAEVFHKSAERWLPINVHPDYRAVASGKRPAVVPEAVASTHLRPVQSPPQRPRADTPPVPPAEPPAPPPDHPRLEGTESPPEPQPTPLLRSTREPLTGGATRAGKLRVMLPMAMGLAALGLIGAGAVLAWPNVPVWLANHRDHRVTLSEGMPPLAPTAPADTRGAPSAPLPAGAATRRLDSLPNVYPAPSKPLAAVPAGSDTASGPDREEETRVSRFTATRTRLPSYFEAYADARSEMDDGFDYVSFRRVFAPSRFAAPESLRAARRMVEAAGNILRVYRGREVMLEQTYRPDDPGGRGSLREPFETAEASRALLADVDSLFGLLVSQQGRFSYANEVVHFQAPRTARNYNQLRAEIIATLSDWRDSSGATNRVTLPRLLQALGGTPPPPAR